MDQTTPSSEKERIRGYVVDVLIKQFLHFHANEAEIARVAKAVLEKTKDVETREQLEQVIHELSEEFPVLKNAELKEMDFKDHLANQSKVKQLVDLLHQGNLDQAAQLTAQFEGTKENQPQQ